MSLKQKETQFVEAKSSAKWIWVQKLDLVLQKDKKLQHMS